MESRQTKWKPGQGKNDDTDKFQASINQLLTKIKD
jgi:hypothetical protein